jgi:septal ring factor EnvC (AmiA/AmiB activator)
MTEAELFKILAEADGPVKACDEVSELREAIAALTKANGEQFDRIWELQEQVAKLKQLLREADQAIITDLTFDFPLRRSIRAALADNKPLLQECEDTRAVLCCFLPGERMPLTNDEMAERMGVSKSESSKRVSNAVSSGYVKRARVGREVAIMPVIWMSEGVQ